MESPIIITAATERDIGGILVIEQDAISPPWTHGALLSEIYRDDSFFAVARVVAHVCSAGAADDAFGRASGSTEDGADSSSNDSADGADGADSASACADVSGFLILRRMGDDGELLQIAVDRASRRCGLAGSLMTAMLEYASANALSSVFLEVRKSNDAAISLYKKFGFTTVRVRRNYYSHPDEDAVVMARGNPFHDNPVN